jgi:RNA polymerase sigma-70 factor (ECF subfamily)
MDFNKIYTDHYDQVKRTAMSFLHNEEDALDATQDTFMSVYESLDQYDDSRTLSTWVVQICINKCRDKLRKAKKERSMFVPLTTKNEHLLDSREEATTPDNILEAEENEKAIFSNFLGMPDNIREALTLRIVQDMSYREIADEMAIPINTAKTWVRRGRTQLLQTISP